MKNLKLKKIILQILLITIVIFSAINIFNPYKKTISEREKRNLATFPTFSIESLFNGKYVTAFESWFSDTFIFRDFFMELNSKYKNMLSIDNYIKNKDIVSFIPAKKLGEDIDEQYEETIINNQNKDNIKNFKQKINDYEEVDYEYDGINVAAEGLSGGFILYDDTAYVKTDFNTSKAVKYLNIINEYAELLGNVRTSIVLAPQSSLLLYGNNKIKMDLVDQNRAINSLIPEVKDKMNIVNPCKRLLDHRDEYLYFKYDHHWTGLGAYYAYQEFCESVGEVAAPLESMSKILLNSAFEGSIYSFTYDERIKGKTDYLYAYLSTRSNAMSIVKEDGTIIDTDNCIRTNFVSYSAFISGDQPFAVINVPSNDQDKCALVLKDSFGCAFVPYLVNNYGYIFVIDPRHTKFDIVEMLKNYKIKDFISVTAIYEPCSDKFRDQTQKLIDISKEQKE